MAAQNENANTNPKKGKFSNLLIIIFIAIVLLALTTGIAYFVATNTVGRSSDNANGSSEKSAKSYVTYDAGEFLTNLSDKGYIKLSLVYLLESKEVQEQVTQKDSEIRDRIFSILRSKTYDSVKDSNGMEDLRKEIKSSLNQILGEGSIVEVYFTSIIVN
ncbi:flagellar basal body-associated FliL family protein [Tepidanaerobacter syntrophicus]|uniref:Flagellar protein FliL n=1 Tax=Tepidanaerobacter syntrophicus TaxID=224999 RepID=A0A0U9HT12_9FIRM|nr:flagellar basal body-associated protein FliL [Tepidanaerobacter syntrophicus]GAQ26247.1 flagellar FliL protein [Tepidanaerobacter syntrophicus]